MLIIGLLANTLYRNLTESIIQKINSRHLLFITTLGCIMYHKNISLINIILGMTLRLNSLPLAVNNQGSTLSLVIIHNLLSSTKMLTGGRCHLYMATTHNQSDI